jgi:hypothetical protein
MISSALTVTGSSRPRTKQTPVQLVTVDLLARVIEPDGLVGAIGEAGSCSTRASPACFGLLSFDPTSSLRASFERASATGCAAR